VEEEVEMELVNSRHDDITNRLTDIGITAIRHINNSFLLQSPSRCRGSGSGFSKIRIMLCVNTVTTFFNKKIFDQKNTVYTIYPYLFFVTDLDLVRNFRIRNRQKSADPQH
jgi:hypothetical protein